MPRRHRRR